MHTFFLALGTNVGNKKMHREQATRLQEREFVLQPFCDIAPDFIHPVLQKSMKELYNSLSF